MPEMTFRHEAGHGHAFSDRFPDSIQGLEVPLMYDMRPNGGGLVPAGEGLKGRVTGAVLIEDGNAIEVTLDVPLSFHRVLTADKPPFKMSVSIDGYQHKADPGRAPVPQDFVDDGWAEEPSE